MVTDSIWSSRQILQSYLVAFQTRHHWFPQPYPQQGCQPLSRSFPSMWSITIRVLPSSIWTARERGGLRTPKKWASYGGCLAQCCLGRGRGGEDETLGQVRVSPAVKSRWWNDCPQPSGKAKLTLLPVLSDPWYQEIFTAARGKCISGLIIFIPSSKENCH